MPDPVLLWNHVALEANRISHTNMQGEQTGPPLSARALAIVHLAIYDAYAGAVNDPINLPRYLPNPVSPGGISADDAVAGAAHEALARLFPSQRPFFDFILDAGGTLTAGHTFGVSVAQAILADRAADPGVGSSTYMPSTSRGRHRPDPDNVQQGFHAPDYGRLSKGFGIATRFELANPPLDNAEYLASLRQVRSKGIRSELIGTLPAGSSPRTTDESLIGVFWGYDGSSQLGTPPRLYNQIVREVAKQKNNSVSDNARLFAFVNVAMADAGILSWDQKYIHDFWRPVVAIREHDTSTGPAAQPGPAISSDSDPFWLPFGAPNSNRIAKNFTPPFPAYPSGHATFGAAALHVTRLFYGEGGTLQAQDLGPDSLLDTLSIVSDELNGVTTDNTGTIRPAHRRTFPGGLWEMIVANGLSRIFLGVHWSFDAFALQGGAGTEPDIYRTDAGKHIGGVPLGLLVAEDIFNVNKKAPAKSSVGPRGSSVASPHRSPTYSSHYVR